ncbi:hypothetical protein [Chelativorans salis]|uniref:Uncharacterized protein n=1 Tax=Chelativorans salis TaxID=2978478 RepID=A0ABT2LMP4_9HYPH|nr:hypothetical protein [Chelativorans sp. EGI FJ00035]MCT7375586.1 hypothetical protein [Chelativorans sp. EGI FJ00035]
MPRVLSLIQKNVGDFTLDLSGLHVVVPAAAGYRAATATLALMAGAASATAITRPSNRYYSAQEAADVTSSLAALAGVRGRLRISERIDHQTCSNTNILVNSDPIPPITRSIIERLPRRSVIAMMSEPWMLLRGEIDIRACQEHRVPISAVNESHPAIGGEDYHAALCLKLFQEAGIPLDKAAVALICGNPLARDLKRGMRAAGAQVEVFPNPDMVFTHSWNAVVLAQRPTDRPSLGIHDLGRIAKVAPNAVILQYWGDIDRKAARYFGLKVWPPRTPGKSQMGMPLEALGPEPMVRLIAGTLKAAELVLAGGTPGPGGVAQFFNASDWSL